MFDRPSLGTRAVLVALDFGDPDNQESIEELGELARSAGVEVCSFVTGKRQRPDPAYFAGTGKADEIKLEADTQEASLVIFNHQLSPTQQRNLERRLQCRVLDRTEIILIIFGQRAQSHEGKLQVQLAQLNHLATRLVKGWSHLERQKGGIGLRGGPGETQLEIDRRLLGKQVKNLKDNLAKIQRQRNVQRKSRSRGGVPTVAIVGYTNAGKSTLFNRLTHSKVYAADQLFATLDTTARKLYLDDQTSVVLTDTVGFIRELPHLLVAAFRATLEETVYADLLLHIVDASHPLRDRQIEEVNKVLAEINADKIPQLIVWNKIDRRDLPPSIERDEYGKICAVSISALHGSGLELLRAAIVEHVSPTSQAQESTYHGAEQ